MENRQPDPYVLPALPEIEREGAFFRSKLDGRYLYLRGVCFGPVAKEPPHLPILSMEDFDRLEPYLDLLLACGFTTLRLPFFWSAYEPVCNPERATFDGEYLESYLAIVHRLSEKGFLLYLDLHQDLLSRHFGGNGFPEWVLEDGARPRALFRNTALWGLNYVMNKGLRRTFTQFWKNDLSNSHVDPPLVNFKVRDRYIEMVATLAAALRTMPRVIGIEVMNEPHPGEIEEEIFEQAILSPFYRQIAQRIMRVHPELFVMLSPQSDWNANLRRDKAYKSHVHADDRESDRLIFAYHYYDALLTGLQGLHFHDEKRDEYARSIRMGVEQAEQKGMLPFLSEFGSRQSWFQSVTDRHMRWHFEAVERSMVHATYWNVNLYNTKRGKDGFMREDFSLLDHELKPRSLDIAVRPYPIAASALPTGMRYNDHNRTFELFLSGLPLEKPTVIFLPFSTTAHQLAPSPFAEGFEIHYNGRHGEELRVELNHAANQLAIWLDPNDETHHLTITELGFLSYDPVGQPVFTYRGGR